LSKYRPSLQHKTDDYNGAGYYTKQWWKSFFRIKASRLDQQTSNKRLIIASYT